MFWYCRWYQSVDSSRRGRVSLCFLVMDGGRVGAVLSQVLQGQPMEGVRNVRG
jgi:hypothetical protein